MGILSHKITNTAQLLFSNSIDVPVDVTDLKLHNLPDEILDVNDLNVVKSYFSNVLQPDKCVL